jgi:hypothetical protein
MNEHEKDDPCFPEGREAALAEARAAGKPLLTMENLNDLAKNQEANKALAAEAIKDIPGFLRRHFHLTRSQDRQLKSVPAAKIRELAEMFKSVAENGGSARFSVETGRTITKRDLHKSKEVTAEISTPIGSAKLTVKTESDQ